MSRALCYLLVVVLAVELAVWESFLVAARPFGLALPLAAAIAVVGNLVLGIAGARVLHRTLGAVIPCLIWLVLVLPLSSRTAAGDLVILQNVRGVAFLIAGTAAAAAAIAVSESYTKA